MKNFLAGILGAAVLCASLGLAACGGKSEKLSVYAPDGAIALALVSAIASEDELFEYHVEDASTISAFVTGKSPKADFCVLPLNAASKLLGTGETYRMLGTVTNGNLYFLTTGEKPALTGENLSSLKGKTVGVAQLNNVPGLALQIALNEHGVEYAIMGNDGAVQADKVNLTAMDASNMTPASGCDYYLIPEPAASTKLAATASAPKPFQPAGSLQALYAEGGFPQAVLVAKKSVIENNAAACEKMLACMEQSESFLTSGSLSVDDILNLLADKRAAGLTPAFNAKNLTVQVIENCSVKFTPSGESKERVNAFLEKLIAVNPDSAAKVNDAFFYAD